MTTTTTLETLSARAEVLRGEGKARRFRMVANTGAEFARSFGRAVVDLSGVKVPGKLPILLNHDANRVVGYADRSERTSEGLVLHGCLVATDAAAEVSRLADQGYPWTASIGLCIERVEQVKDGDSARCNGREVSGPLAVWRCATLTETSFISANPADRATSVALLSGEGGSPREARARRAATFLLSGEDLATVNRDVASGRTTFEAALSGRGFGSLEVAEAYLVAAEAGQVPLATMKYARQTDERWSRGR